MGSITKPIGYHQIVRLVALSRCCSKSNATPPVRAKDDPTLVWLQDALVS